MSQAQDQWEPANDGLTNLDVRALAVNSQAHLQQLPTKKRRKSARKSNNIITGIFSEPKM